MYLALMNKPEVVERCSKLMGFEVRNGWKLSKSKDFQFIAVYEQDDINDIVYAEDVIYLVLARVPQDFIDSEEYKYLSESHLVWYDAQNRYSNNVKKQSSYQSNWRNSWRWSS